MLRPIIHYKSLFRCDDCGRSFAHVSNLYRHMRIHSKERPYVCEECGKRFLQVSGLNQHLRIHITSPAKEGDSEVPKGTEISLAADEDGDSTKGSINKECRVLLTRLEDDEDVENKENINEALKYYEPFIEKEMLLTEAEMLIENQDTSQDDALKAEDPYKDEEDGKKSPRKSERLAGKSFSCLKCGDNFRNEGVAKGHLQVRIFVTHDYVSMIGDYVTQKLVIHFVKFKLQGIQYVSL